MINIKNIKNIVLENLRVRRVQYSFPTRQNVLRKSFLLASLTTGLLVAQTIDPFYGSSPTTPSRTDTAPQTTPTHQQETPSSPTGIKTNLAQQFQNPEPLPHTDFFQGELGEAYTAFTETPFLADKVIPGWQDFTLGMHYTDLTNLIKSETYPWLTIKGDYEPILTLETNIFFVETYANRYFNNVQFLFDKEQRLYLIRLRPLPSYFSFIELINQFKKKYGKPSELSFKQITWIGSEGRRLELRRDSSIRYLRADILVAGTLSTQTDLNTASPSKVDENAFKTKLLENF